MSSAHRTTLVSVAGALAATGFLLAVPTGAGASAPLLPSAPLCFEQEATIVGDGTGTIVGTESDDVIVTTGGRVEALGGDDLVCGAAEVDGGEGDDQLRGGDGQDVLDGGSGEDYVDAGPGRDACDAELMDDCEGPLDPVPLDTPCFGETPTIMSDALEVVGTDDDDVIRVRGGHVIGGDGNDRVCGPWSVFGGEGNDQLEVAWGTFDDYSFGGPGDDVIREVSPAGLGSYARAHGNAGVDLLVGGPRRDILLGGSGNDVVRGRGGDDSLSGHVGDDLLMGGAGDDKANGRSGDDLLRGGTGNDILTGRKDDDTIYGGSGDDLLRGVAGDDIVEGRAGDDTVLGGIDDDLLRGGPGNDYLDGVEGRRDRAFGGPDVDECRNVAIARSCELPRG